MGEWNCPRGGGPVGLPREIESIAPAPGTALGSLFWMGVEEGTHQHDEKEAGRRSAPTNEWTLMN